MREEELVIRYRIPSIPEDTAPKEMKLMKEAQRHFGQQVIGMVMEHMAQNGVELLEARKKFCGDPAGQGPPRRECRGDLHTGGFPVKKKGQGCPA